MLCLVIIVAYCSYDAVGTSEHQIEAQVVSAESFETGSGNVVMPETLVNDSVAMPRSSATVRESSSRVVPSAAISSLVLRICSAFQ